MKSLTLFKKVIYLLMSIAVIGVTTNTALAQSKKKLVRIIEIDDKGEHVVREINLSGDKQVIVEDIDKARIDSISKSMQKKIEIERGKIDSLHHQLMVIAPRHIPIPPIPDFDFDLPEPVWVSPDFGHDFDIFLSDSAINQTKMYYNEKGFGKDDDLSKILEDLENGTFDPTKWNMKEIDKDNLKDFKTNGKGDVIIFGDNAHNPYFYSYPHKKAMKFKRGHRCEYLNGDFVGDSLDKNHMEEFSIQTTMGSDGDDDSNIVVVSPGSRNYKRAYLNGDNEGEKMVKVIVMSNDKARTKIEFTNPSNDDLKIIEKAGLAKEDKSKRLSPDFITLMPSKEKGKFKFSFDTDEKGKASVIIVDNTGKKVFSGEFEVSKDDNEKDVEINDLKTGDYFIQAQLNGKAITLKMEVNIKS